MEEKWNIKKLKTRSLKTIWKFSFGNFEKIREKWKHWKLEKKNEKIVNNFILIKTSLFKLKICVKKIEENMKIWEKNEKFEQVKKNI